MTFLNPAVLFGLFAAAIPVLLHLLNLRKLKTIEFSTLFFLKELQKNKIRKIKLKQLILLALRVLIILFLVTAFARPALKGVSIGGTTSAAKTTAVFIIDDTFSMSAVGTNGSMLNRAKQISQRLLNELQEGDEVAVIKVSDFISDKPVAMSNISAAVKEVNELNPAYKSGTLHKAIAKAAAILSESRNFNKEIYVLSDFQKSRLNEPGEKFSDFGLILDEKTKLYLFKLTKDEPFNMGIDSLKLNNQIFEEGKPVSFSCSVKNYSQRSVTNSVVSLFINGGRSAQNSVSLSPGESKTITFETVIKSPGFIEVYAETEDDDIIQDNRKYLCFNIPGKTSIAIFSSDPSDIRYIEMAVSAGGQAFNIASKNTSQLGSCDLGSFNSIIISDASAIPAYAGSINAYIKSGGGLLLLPSSGSNFSEFQSALKSLSLPSPSATAGARNSFSLKTFFDYVDYSHPVFSGMFSNNSKKQIESPEIYYYYKINTQGRGKNIISLIDNSSFMSEYSIGQGKVIVLAVSASLEWSNLPVKALFAPLMYRSVSYLSFNNSTDNLFTAGNTADINLKNRNMRQIKIIRPDNSSEIVNIDESAKEYFSYANTDITGCYKVISGGNVSDYFSVNTNPLESVMNSATPDELNNYLKSINFRGKEFSFDADNNYLTKIKQARFGSELWRLFLALALICAIAEMIISRTPKNELE